VEVDSIWVIVNKLDAVVEEKDGIISRTESERETARREVKRVLGELQEKKKECSKLRRELSDIDTQLLAAAENEHIDLRELIR
jgi:septation ring formation regulator EzrA